jgi:hypothetical protein
MVRIQSSTPVALNCLKFLLFNFLPNLNLNLFRLEDFGLELKRDAVNYIIEFVYRGEVDILGEKLTDFCAAAHTLGVLGQTLPSVSVVDPEPDPDP